jgi:hypothetical protein
MNSQAEIIRKTLKKLSNTGNLDLYHDKNNESNFRFGDDYKTRKIAEGILNAFPEEDSRSVKAYRALEFLLRYMADSDFHFDYEVDDRVLTSHLTRIQGKIEEEAREDIKSRLKKDESSNSFGGEDITIHDPVSKLSRNSSLSQEELKFGSDTLEITKDEFAQRILVEPLR